MNANPFHAMALPSWEADVVRHNSRRTSVATNGLWRVAARAWHEPPADTCSVVSARPLHARSIKFIISDFPLFYMRFPVGHSRDVEYDYNYHTQNMGNVDYDYNYYNHPRGPI